jgi:hypothetical protein
MTTPDSCILWPVVDADGYGRIGKTLAHRRVWESVHGPIAEGLDLDHLCVVPNCVNVRHLEPVTPEENQARKARRRTHCKNEHEMTEENTYVHPTTGYRQCRICISDASKRYYAKRKN